MFIYKTKKIARERKKREGQRKGRKKNNEKKYSKCKKLRIHNAQLFGMHFLYMANQSSRMSVGR